MLTDNYTVQLSTSAKWQCKTLELATIENRRS